MDFFKQIANGFHKPQVDYSQFDMGHEHKTTMRFGSLTPVFLQEVLPGDKWHINPSAFVRTMPLVSPMMHKVDLKIRFFFVPNRLVWKNWERFISGGRDPKTGGELFVPTFTLPQATGGSPDGDLYTDKYFAKGSLCDYFGIPLRSHNDNGNITFFAPTISQLPFRAYDLIYQEYFCNQHLEGHNIDNSFDGADFYEKWNKVNSLTPPLDHKMLSDIFLTEDVLFEPDYFTSALPTPMATPHTSGLRLGNNDHSVRIGGHQAIEGSLYPNGEYSTTAQPTVNELRQAFRLQHFLENSLRTGKRYIEQIFGHFGVESSDARLQRPEYLGGGTLALQVSEVASTAEMPNGSQLGDLAGRGISVGNFGDINFTSEEHGFLFGLAYIVPRSSYFGGIPKTFLRHERFDFAFPEFATLGEQPLYTCELDATQPTDKLEIFGYVPRYSEYKQQIDRFSGDMVGTLAYWHLGRNLAKANPKLNADFVHINDKARRSLNRVFGVTEPNAHPFVCSFGFAGNAIRPLPFNPQSML